VSQGAIQSAVVLGRRSVSVRGTQSFVGVMAAVWKRPSLTAIEVLWRWVVGIPFLAICAWEAMRLEHLVTPHVAALETMTVFKPVEAAATLGATARALLPAVLTVALWLLPLWLVIRTVAAAIGRAAVLRKLGAGAQPRFGTLFVLSGLRIAALVLVLAVWVFGVRWANGFAITGPASRGQEPNVVLLFALVVFGTLALFVAWALSIWALDASITLAAVRGDGVIASLRGVSRIGPMRGKLIEMNFVMGIVKVALIVLAMVFSACPLPFQNVESPAFLAWWWTGVGVLYLVASDYFHVVRMAAALALHRLYQTSPETNPAS
jgi:hypothetical protein